MEILGKEIGYNLHRVPRSNKNGYVEQFLHDTTSGKFIAQLKFTTGENHHIVGIDCDKRVIFDSMEDYAMTLTKSNLDACSGSKGSKLAKIPFCFELKPSGKQFKKKARKDL